MQAFAMDASDLGVLSNEGSELLKIMEQGVQGSFPC
jgi:hypothetical protein